MYELKSHSKVTIIKEIVARELSVSDRPNQGNRFQ